MPSVARERRGSAVAVRPGELSPAQAARASRARPRVCFVALRAWPVISADPHIAEVGGAEVQQSILARLFAAEGYRVSMICLDYGQPERVLIDGVTVHRTFHPQSGIPGLRFLPRVAALWHALRRADADIYYCRSAGMLTGLVAEFCRRHGRRSIYAGASDMDFVPGEGGQIRYARDRWLYRRGLARVDRIVAQNEAQRESCRANYGREALLIPSCYEPPRAAQAGRVEKDRVLWVGTIRAGKRPELLLELAARLPQRRFVMVGGPGRGETALYERVRSEAAALANLEFTGFLPLSEVEPWFDRARVLVNTSTYEGMPNTFLQAWARGVPTLATVDVGASAHRVFATPDEGARAIDRLFESPADWERAARGCLQHFERTHSRAEVLARYGRLFAELCA